LSADIWARALDGRRSNCATGILRVLSDATVLHSADVAAARNLIRLVGGGNESVELAAALAVRGVRLGHVCVDLATAATTVAPDDEDFDVDLSALAWPPQSTWADLVAASPLTAVGPDGPADRPLRLIGTRLYLDRYWRHERAIAADVAARLGGDAPRWNPEALDEGLDRLFGADAPGPENTPSESETGRVDGRQRAAAQAAVQRLFTVIVGGPGTGKTTAVARIVALLYEQAAALGDAPPRVALAAPTGKAAARLAEAVHDEAAGLDVDRSIRAALAATPASTLHRLLGWQPGNRSRFRHDQNNQLPHNAVIVDECSMVGLSMMAKLLAAVRPGCRLILVGDPRQLASVEAGAVLGDIAGTGLSAVVSLRQGHRYGGGIARLAQTLEAGDADGVVEALKSSPADVTWLNLEPDSDATASRELAPIRHAVVETARRVVAAARLGDGAAALVALRSVQVLCAHRRGPAGAAHWRNEIERWLRSAIAGYGEAGDVWFAGRPLLVTENDHALGVYNGDTGVVIDEGAGRLRAVFERRGELLAVRPSRLASVESLYAMTIHKAQGSQFAHVVLQLPDPGSRVLTRELLYTAVTRAQNQLTVVGSEAAVRAAVARPVARASGLAEALAGVSPAL